MHTRPSQKGFIRSIPPRLEHRRFHPDPDPAHPRDRPPALLPVPRVAAPSGPYQVGTQTFVLTDTCRQELYSGKEEPRKFMIQVWYPAAPRSDDIHAPWMEEADIFAPAIAES